MIKVADWQPGTTVMEAVLAPGTRVSMLIDEMSYAAIQAGKTERAYGGWATFDSVPSQRYARDVLAITEDMKADVRHVVELEINRPVSAHIGIVGAQSGALGGGNQVHFVLPPSERSTVFKVIGHRELR